MRRPALPRQHFFRTAIISTLILFCMFAGYAFSKQDGAESKLIRVTLEHRWQQQALLDRGYDIALLRPGQFADIVVTSRELAEIVSLGLSYEVRSEDIAAQLQPLMAAEEFGLYHSYNEVVAELDSLQTEYPSLLRVYDIGDSWEKTQSIADRDIWAAKLTDFPDFDEGEPTVLFIGNHHAREIITPEIVLYILNYLLTNYGTDPEVTAMVDEREIWFVPIMNPDGHVYVQQVNGMWRKNRRDNGDGSYGVDLNRNYSYEWGHDNYGSSPSTSSETYRGPSPFSEPEATSIRDFAIDHEFTIALSYHSYGNMFLYPWGYMPGFTEDQDVFHTIAESLAAYNGYAIGNNGSGLIYATNGDSDDWFYGDAAAKPKCFCYTPEVGTAFAPPESQIDPLCQENLGPALFIIKHADYPYRLVPPGSVEIDSLGTVGPNYTLQWRVGSADTNAIQFELVEKTDPIVFTDDAESTYVPWTMEGGFTLSTGAYHSANHSYYSGSANKMNSILACKEGYNVQPDDTLWFWCNFDIETNYDYAYVEVSTDGGRSFNPIPGNLTTDNDPYGNNIGNGITGSSAGWVQGFCPIGQFAGKTIWVRFRYWTDSYVLGNGVYVDDVSPVIMYASTDTIASDLPLPKYTFTGKGAGTYFYQVRGMDAEGHWGYAGETEMVVVDPLISVSEGMSVDADAIHVAGFPNPFNPGVTLKYTLAAKPHGEPWAVRIRVFDAGGRLVRQLYDGRVSAVEGRAFWDGTDENGKALPSGVYFYRLEADRISTSGKVVLIR